jgi:hypothetical protein
MAFNVGGTFAADTTQYQGLDDLLTAAKKKKQVTQPPLQPANTFAPVINNRGAVGTYGAGQSNGTGQGQGTPGGAAPSGAPGAPASPSATPVYPDNPQQPTDTTTGSSGPPEPPANVVPETHYISNDPNSPYYWQTLGYADESWAGLPYEIGWWETDADGNQTNWVQQRDMTPIAQQIHDLQNAPVPERPELTDITTTAPMQGIEDLIAIWNDPNTAIADREAAVAQFAAEMGMTSEELTAMLNNMVGGLNQGVQGQQGLTDEYTQAYNRETGLELQNMRDNYRMMLESMSAGGRDVAGYQAMDQIARSLSTFQMQRDIERMNLDMAAKQSEYDALMGRMTKLQEMKEVTAQQLIDARNTNRMNALTGYAQEISAFISQNQLVLQAYSADLQAAQLHAEIIYKGIMADMGVSESMMTQMQDYYEMYMAPYYAELERWSLETQARQQDQANNISTAGTVIQGIGVVVGTIALIASSAICREMYRLGYLPHRYLKMDEEFGMLVMTRRPDVYRGYQIFCDWIIPKMRKSKGLVLIVNIFFQAWMRDMLNLMGHTRKKSRFGRFINKIGFMILGRIGRNAEVRLYGKLVTG